MAPARKKQKLAAQGHGQGDSADAPPFEADDDQLAGKTRDELIAIIISERSSHDQQFTELGNRFNTVSCQLEQIAEILRPVQKALANKPTAAGPEAPEGSSEGSSSDLGPSQPYRVMCDDLVDLKTCQAGREYSIPLEQLHHGRRWNLRHHRRQEAKRIEDGSDTEQSELQDIEIGYHDNDGERLSRGEDKSSRVKKGKGSGSDDDLGAATSNCASDDSEDERGDVAESEISSGHDDSDADTNDSESEDG